MEKLYGIIEVTYGGCSNQSLNDSILFSIFNFKCTNETDDGWALRAVGTPSTDKEVLAREAEEKNSIEFLYSKHSKYRVKSKIRYIVKEVEDTELGYRMKVTNAMIKKAVKNVTNLYPHLSEKVKAEYRQYI